MEDSIMSIVEHVPSNDYLENRKSVSQRTKQRVDVVYTPNGLKRAKVDIKSKDC